MKQLRIIFAGGGTGGHLFPALAIAQKLKQVRKSADISFIGTRKGLEGKIIPDSGFGFHPIWISGISREKNMALTLLKNLFVPFKLFIATLQSLYYLLKHKQELRNIAEMENSERFSRSNGDQLFSALDIIYLNITPFSR